MMHSKTNLLSIWLILFSCSAAYSQIYLLKAPQFTQAAQEVAIYASLDVEPSQVKLNWISDTQDGHTNMIQDPRSGCWIATIPARAIQGTKLSYSVTADYDQSPAVTTEQYTLFICPQFTALKPEPMTLNKTVVAEKKWNSDDTAFGLLKPEEGPPIGPSSIAYHKGDIYLLDNVKKRVLRYNKAGKTRPAITVPSSKASDLVIDSDDESVLVVSQLEDKVYHFRNGKLDKTQSVKMKRELGYPAKFRYDRQSKTLLARRQNRQESKIAVTRQNRSIQTADQIEQTPEVLTEVQNNCLLVKTDSNPKIFAVTFNQPAGYIDETAVDANGIVWILYSMKGDYRIRRLARIDTLNETAEVCVINVWFSFDATRRMTATDKGIALMAGDTNQGRILAFDYAGGVK